MVIIFYSSTLNMFPVKLVYQGSEKFFQPDTTFSFLPWLVWKAYTNSTNPDRSWNGLSFPVWSVRGVAKSISSHGTFAMKQSFLWSCTFDVQNFAQGVRWIHVTFLYYVLLSSTNLLQNFTPFSSNNPNSITFVEWKKNSNELAN